MTISNNRGTISKISQAKVPTSWGNFDCYVFQSEMDAIEHLAFVNGSVENKDNVLVRVHSECITGDIFHSRKCDCGDQLERAMEAIAKEDGIFIYLRGHEGRGIGIGAKIKAYSLQEQGLDTVQANEELGLPVDDRNYEIAALILQEFKVGSIELITNNMNKVEELQSFGIQVVKRISLVPNITDENLSYLKTKNAKLGHLIEGVES